jgi:hypothetical protein
MQRHDSERIVKWTQLSQDQRKDCWGMQQKLVRSWFMYSMYNVLFIRFFSVKVAMERIKNGALWGCYLTGAYSSTVHSYMYVVLRRIILCALALCFLYSRALTSCFPSC